MMSGFEIDTSELAENPTARCPCVLALDVSGSMSGPPIAELNAGVQQLYQEIQDDEVAKYSVEIGIVSFSSFASIVTQLSSIDGPVPPALQAGGSTSLGEGVNLSLDILEKRKALYKQMGVPYYQPWLVMMTDGQPTDEWRSAAERVHDLAERKKLVFFGIAVGDAADMDTLQQICPANRPPVRLKGIRFREFFSWLSASMSSVSASFVGDSVALPAIDGWAQVQV